MSNESNKPNISERPVEQSNAAHKPSPLTRGDILSDDALHLSDVSPIASSSEPGNTAVTSGAALQVDELLSSIDSHPSVAGGILTFDSDSSPGQTIVRVMLDDNGTQQAFEVGVFNGGGMDLNSLLGLISPPGADHS